VVITQFTTYGVLEGNDGILVLGSPLLTKLGFGYTAISTGTTIIVVKSIDYTANTAVDLAFQDSVHYLNTVSGMNVNTELDFNDYFLVVRNGSHYNPSNPNNIPCE
jgi:hypothetical protein